MNRFNSTNKERGGGGLKKILLIKSTTIATEEKKKKIQRQLPYKLKYKNNNFFLGSQLSVSFPFL